eukprot:4517673-Karenia_brevis.AAC.1
MLACLENRIQPTAALQEAQQAAPLLDAAGMEERPTWSAMLQGARPPSLTEDERVAGEWTHGWQYYASDALEQQEYSSLLGASRGYGTAGPARL